MRKAEDAITNLLYLAKRGTVQITYNGTDIDKNNLWTITLSGNVLMEKANYHEVITTLAKGSKGIAWI